MKYYLTILFFSFCFCAIAQNNSFVKYFDSAWQPSAKEKASFYTQFEKQDTLYKCTSYYLPSNKLFGTSTFYDTLFKRGIGKMVRYYESGKVKDSGFRYSATNSYTCSYTYHKNGNVEDSIYTNSNGAYTYYRFYENGRLFGRMYYDKDNLMSVNVAYDTSGKVIPNYIFLQTPAFDGGLTGWITYLQKNLKSNLPVRKGAPAGKYSVVLKFTIDKEGKTSDIYAENDPGYGTKEEAIRVLKKSPKWIPAIFLNEKATFNHSQTITFMVSEQ